MWACVDADGDYGVGKDEDAATTAYDDKIGGRADRGIRYVKITVKVPLPVAIELSGECPAEPAAGSLSVKVA